MWNRIKKVFKRKPKRDQVVSFDGGKIGLKDVLPYKLEPKHKGDPEIAIHVKFIERSLDGFIWSVNGKIIHAEDIISAQRKYLKEYTK